MDKTLTTKDQSDTTRQVTVGDKAIKYWRGRICTAMDVSYPPLAASRLDAVIVAFAQWVK